jgi:hypothetical protein
MGVTWNNPQSDDYGEMGWRMASTLEMFRDWELQRCNRIYMLIVGWFKTLKLWCGSSPLSIGIVFGHIGYGLFRSITLLGMMVRIPSC